MPRVSPRAVLCVVASVCWLGCVEPKQAKPTTPITGGDCSHRQDETPVDTSRSPDRSNANDGGDGYGYELAQDPLCAGGGIVDPRDDRIDD